MKSTKQILAVALAAILVCIGAVAVFAKPEGTSYQTGTFDSANQYLNDEVTILTRAVTDEGTLSTIATASEYFLKSAGGKDYNYFGILVCEPADDGYYKVISTDFTTGRPDGVKSDVEIPEDGFILAINATKTELFAKVQTSAVVGDFVKISGVDISNLELEEATVAELTGASWELFHDDGTVEESEEESVAESEAAESIEETSKPKTPDTGDTSAVFVIASVIALAGVVVAKKVRN